MQDNDGGDFVLERASRLSQSVLWTYPRQFFERWGVDAWRRGIAPRYITSNPYIARSYARVVRAWLRDWRRPAAGADAIRDLDQPIVIVELGSGSGRFAYHFLSQFLEMLPPSPARAVPIRYVMTDVSEPILECWQAHSKLRPMVEMGLLDFALFDPVRDHGRVAHCAGLSPRGPGVLRAFPSAGGSSCADALQRGAVLTRLGQREIALQFVNEALAADPGFGLARTLRLQIEARS